MSDAGSVTLTRQELYDRVWATAIRNLAREYDLSDVGLANICKAHNIPRPPVGYWAKKEFGKAPPQTPLPLGRDPLERVTLPKRPPEAPHAPPPPPPQYDSEIVELLERAKSLPPVTVASALRNPHPLVQATKAAFQDAQPDPQHLMTPYSRNGPQVIAVRVSKACISRALLFLDAFVKAVERLGGKVIVEKRWHQQTVVYLADEEAATIRLRERYKQQRRKPDPKDTWQWPSYDYFPTGKLLLESGPSSYAAPHCEDTPEGGRIETTINSLLISFVQSLGKKRIKRREEAEEQRRREEAERIRREREAELRRRREELQRKQKEEQARVDELLDEATRWRQSRVLRAYLRDIEARAGRNDGVLATRPDLGEWLAWARQQADRLDPLAPNPASILDAPLP